jgi:hypothetical protein
MSLIEEIGKFAAELANGKWEDESMVGNVKLKELAWANFPQPL